MKPPRYKFECSSYIDEQGQNVPADQIPASSVTGPVDQSYLQPPDVNGDPSGTNFVVRTSGTEVRAKEVILVSLAFMLLAFSISLFFKHWKKNYWDINQLPYYAQCYEDEEIPTATAPAAVPTLKTQVSTSGNNELIATFPNHESASLFDVACSLSRTHSIRPTFKHNRARTVSSFGGARSSISRSKMTRLEGHNDLQEGFGHKRALSDASFKGHSSQMVTNTQCQPLRRCHSGYAPQVGRLSPRSTGNLYQSKKLRRILSSCEEIPSGVIESGQTALGEEFKIVIASASPSSLSNSTIHNV